ncbi:hypothetical protein ASG29_02540 [Sphingomonas sp. Leaf412]|uniref:DUF6489 family protein n=1 Tax=Sphingomonas sp. Leaf412 TaxID=1736370 RepID=UPI0006FCEE2E|nr:DUF6489 family protein [Sphingomonas sp. Leaf412]KQT35029.1 hypothetical protein ASG29_02540 [Sphingomonas sp. Leaf412]
MKWTIEVDCTPEEVRRIMGLPDLTPIHERYLAKMQEAVENGTVGPEIVGQMMKSWAPMGDAGMDFWRKLLAGGTRPTG